MRTARISEYQTFGELWQLHLKPYKANCPLKRFPFEAKQTNGCFELNEMIHLPEWPERARTGDARRLRKEIDILVHAKEKFSLAKPREIEESKITVSYFRTESDPPTAKPLSTIRFDYDLPLRASHPLFHFHCCSKPVDSPNPDTLESWKYDIVPVDNHASYPFRVPTPHMNLCSVLLGLVAEHLDPDNFHSLWEAIQKKGWQPPPPAKTNLWDRCKQNAQAGEPFHSWQWYFWDEE